jgi:hypothetical protein
MAAAAAAVFVSEPAMPVVDLAVVPAPHPLVLYAIEESLQMLTDTAEMVPPEQEEEFRVAFQQALTAAVEKRDRTGQFIAHLYAQDEFTDAEIKRLQERKAFFRRAIERVEGYVLSTILSLGRDARGKLQKLEGRSVTFQAKKCPPSVEITDAELVAAQYKTATVTIPMALWDELLDSLDLDFAGKIADAVKNAKIDISKTAIKDALKGNAFVDGARLVDDKYRLERK